MGIKTSGRERLSSIQKMPLLWEKSAEPSATDAVSANVTSELPNIDGRTNGSASNQSNGIVDKGTPNSPTGQTTDKKTPKTAVTAKMRKVLYIGCILVLYWKIAVCRYRKSSRLPPHFRSHCGRKIKSRAAVGHDRLRNQATAHPHQERQRTNRHHLESRSCFEAR